MNIRLVGHLFGARTYKLTVTPEALVLSEPEGHTLLLPFASLRHFNLEGESHSLSRFVLETDTELYEGRFSCEADARAFLSLLRSNCDCYVDIRLDMG